MSGALRGLRALRGSSSLPHRLLSSSGSRFQHGQSFILPLSSPSAASEPALQAETAMKLPPCLAERRKVRTSRRPATVLEKSAGKMSRPILQRTPEGDLSTQRGEEGHETGLGSKLTGTASSSTEAPSSSRGAATQVRLSPVVKLPLPGSSPSERLGGEQEGHSEVSRELALDTKSEEMGSPDDASPSSSHETLSLPSEDEDVEGPRVPEQFPLYRIPAGILPLGRGERIKFAEFIKSSADVSQCPADGRPEIAVIGRSNVGKSSLINMLTNRRELAQTSKKPGKTQLINHFLINDNWYLVDLPGYGYAVAPKDVRTEWHSFTQNYFLNRENLVTVLLLVDASIPPLQVDLDCADWMGQNKMPLTIVFTKCDRRKKRKNGGRPPAENVADFEQRLLEYYEESPPWIMTSSVNTMGKDTLLSHISQLITHWKS